MTWMMPVRRIALWYMHPQITYLTAEIASMNRDYENGSDAWTVELWSCEPDAMRFLSRFSAGQELVLTYADHGRKDLWHPDRVIARLTNCSPLTAGVPEIISDRVDDVLAYKLTIRCELDFLPLVEI